MMSRPDVSLPDWFVADPADRVEPAGSKKTSGWIPLEPLPAQNENWLNYSVSMWLDYMRKCAFQYDAVVGSGDDCTHATLEAVVADAAITANAVILINESITGGAVPISLTKAGWRIYARPGVTLTKGSATAGLSVEASGVELHGLRFAAFDTSGDKAVTFAVTGTYGRVVNCNFLDCDTEIDDASVVGGKKPVATGNITEL